MKSTQDEVFSGFTLLVARLWKAKWLIFGFAFVFMVLTYINLKFIALEIFQSEAVLYLGKEVDPPIFTTLLKNPETLDAVRDRFHEQFPDAKGVDDLNRFKKRFHIDEVILEDNSLRKVYSPAVTVAADAHSPKESQALTSIWVEEIVSRFGGVSGLEARFRSQHSRELLDELKRNEQKAVALQVALRLKAEDLEKQLALQMKLLAPVESQSGKVEREFRPFVKGFDLNTPRLSVSMPGAPPSGEPGMIERQLRLQSDLEKSRAQLKAYESEIPTIGETGESGSLKVALRGKATELRVEIAGMVAEEALLTLQIAKARDEITSLSLALQSTQSELAAANAEVAALRLQQEVVGSELAENSADGYLSSREGLEGTKAMARMDFNVVASPSLPDKKIAPQRVVSAILAGIVGALLSCFVVALSHFVEQLPEVRRKKGK